ncbi:DUF485 domain-containing protein [Streptomyces hiroshimensis]|uniref:DUF485 domain-containing protein n=1 Tax=Streptomyces hiroshimensis TaxID=66424 RepID=UPI001E31F835|nr:DUF485 domain-containing protein [Streptomyces hiroshimensis]
MQPARALTAPDISRALTAPDIYREVQRGAAFREVRSRYRRFAFPAAAAFLLWYLAYVVTATAAPGLMARPVAGALNVAMLAGLAQFATTFLLTWAYARHARLHRDPAALELRWAVTLETRQEWTGQERTQEWTCQEQSRREGEHA